MVKTVPFHHSVSIPDQGTKIPQATWHSQKKIKFKKKCASRRVVWLLDDPLDGMCPQHVRSSCSTMTTIIHAHVSSYLHSSGSGCNPMTN